MGDRPYNPDALNAIPPPDSDDWERWRGYVAGQLKMHSTCFVSLENHLLRMRGEIEGLRTIVTARGAIAGGVMGAVVSLLVYLLFFAGAR